MKALVCTFAIFAASLLGRHKGVEGTKGSGVFSREPLGRPRGHKVAAIPYRLAMRRAHGSSPKGRPRCTLARMANNSAVACGRFARATQPRGRSSGQSLNHAASFGAHCAPHSGRR